MEIKKILIVYLLLAIQSQPSLNQPGYNCQAISVAKTIIDQRFQQHPSKYLGVINQSIILSNDQQHLKLMLRYSNNHEYQFIIALDSRSQLQQPYQFQLKQLNQTQIRFFSPTMLLNRPYTNPAVRTINITPKKTENKRSIRISGPSMSLYQNPNTANLDRIWKGEQDMKIERNNMNIGGVDVQLNDRVNSSLISHSMFERNSKDLFYGRFRDDIWGQQGLQQYQDSRKQELEKQIKYIDNQLRQKIEFDRDMKAMNCIMKLEYQLGTKDSQDRFIQTIGKDRYDKFVANLRMQKQNSIDSFAGVVNTKVNRIEFWFENNFQNFILGPKMSQLIIFDLMSMRFYKFQVKQEVYDEIEQNQIDDGIQRRIVFDFAFQNVLNQRQIAEQLAININKVSKIKMTQQDIQVFSDFSVCLNKQKVLDDGQIYKIKNNLGQSLKEAIKQQIIDKQIMINMGIDYETLLEMKERYEEEQKDEPQYVRTIPQYIDKFGSDNNYLQVSKNIVDLIMESVGNEGIDDQGLIKLTKLINDFMKLEQDYLDHFVSLELSDYKVRRAAENDQEYLDQMLSRANSLLQNIDNVVQMTSKQPPSIQATEQSHH